MTTLNIEHRNHLQLSIVAALGIGALGRFWFLSYYNGKKSKPSLPPLVEDVGMIETVKEMTGGRLKDFLIEQYQKMGDIFRLPFPSYGPMVVVVANTEDARSIYKDPANIKPPLLYSSLDRFSSGPNIVTIPGKEGDSWYHRRKGISPAFVPKLVKRMNQVAIEKTESWINNTLLPVANANNSETSSPKSFNVGREMILLTISVICKAAFEYDVIETDCKELLNAMGQGIEEFAFKSMFNPLRQFGTWILPDRRNAFQEIQKLNDFARKVMEMYRSNPAPVPDTLIDLIMKNPNYKDDSERIPDIIMILFAGHDTTGYTLAFALRELARNPDEQQKLRVELLMTKNDEGASANPYLKAVLDETMRLNPATPVTGFKQMGADFITKDGYLIPKGSITFMGFCALVCDPLLFPEPFEFRPSRWLPENVNQGAKQALFPFSLGRRNCVGQPLATAELQSVLPYLIRQFEFTVEEEGQAMTQGTLWLTNCYLKVRKIAD